MRPHETSEIAKSEKTEDNKEEKKIKWRRKFLKVWPYETNKEKVFILGVSCDISNKQ